MGLLGNIFENPALKKLAFGQLKSLMVSEKLGLIVVRLDGDGELAFDLYKPGEAIISVATPDNTNVTTLNESENQFLLPEKPADNANDQTE